MEDVPLIAGENFTLTLPGLGSAGYQWFVVVQNPEIVRVTKVEKNLSARPGTNSGESEQFVISGLMPGQTHVWFTQKRIFQSANPPNAVREVLVRVGQKTQ